MTEVAKLQTAMREMVKVNAELRQEILALLIDLSHNGLTYWEPTTTRGRDQRAAMFQKINAMIEKLGK